MEDANLGKVRLDKWLWAARFFKTRSLAQAAIEGGKVYVDNMRVKPSKTVSVGDTLLVTTPGGRYEVVVEKLSSKRGPASQAVGLYRETEEGRQRREALNEARKLAPDTAPSERPNSRDRRILRRLKERDG